VASINADDKNFKKKFLSVISYLYLIKAESKYDSAFFVLRIGRMVINELYASRFAGSFCRRHRHVLLCFGLNPQRYVAWFGYRHLSSGALNIPDGRSFYSKNANAPDDIRWEPNHKQMTGRRR
jgi:hypothetical protein